MIAHLVWDAISCTQHFPSLTAVGMGSRTGAEYDALEIDRKFQVQLTERLMKCRMEKELEERSNLLQPPRRGAGGIAHVPSAPAHVPSAPPTPALAKHAD